MNRVVFDRLRRGFMREASVLAGRCFSLERTLDQARRRPVKLGLELTNTCNANCVFCPYQYQRRSHETMADDVFELAVRQFVECGGGDIELTPIVGESLIDPDFVSRVVYLRARPQVRDIQLITNGILIDQHGARQILQSGLSEIIVSTAGFEEEMYRRVYRSSAYSRMRQNVLDLLKTNAELGMPVKIVLALRPDRPIGKVLADKDFSEILKYRPLMAALRSYSDAGGLISADDIPKGIRLRVLRNHVQPCAYLFEGPVVLSNGDVLACHCFDAVDSESLTLGNIKETHLRDLWKGRRLGELRDDFGTDRLNETCRGCTSYRSTRVFRSAERRRAVRS